MAFVKRHLFLLICGAVGLAAIVAGVMGASGSDVVEGMEAGVRLESDIRRLSSGPAMPDGQRLSPVNAKAIEARQAYIAAIQENHGEIVSKVAEISQRPMLMEGVFPTTNDTTAVFTFKAKYQKAMDALLSVLKVGSPPTNREVQEMEAAMKAESAPGPNEQGVLSGTNKRSPGRRPSRNTSRDRKKRQVRSRDKALSAAEAAKAVKENPAVRAAISRAKSIQCYASPDSLTRVLMGAGAPRGSVMWHAQMTYLIQRDVVEALAAVNEQAIQAQSAQGQETDSDQNAPWVGVLPVKDLLSIRVGGGGIENLYIGSAGEVGGVRRRSASRGGGPGGPPLQVDAAFTGKGSNELYDVIRFTVRLVVDSRDALLVLNEISKTNFYVPLNVNYSAAWSDPTLTKKIYGSDPTVEMTVDFDGYFFREAYLKLMPPDVKALVGAE